MKSGHHSLRRAALAAALTMQGLVVQAAPDASRGERLYVRCMACHALAMDRVGPRHCGLIDRRAGSVAGFHYTAAMRKSGLVWDEKTLHRFLQHPLKVVPGSSMTYDGMPDAAERSDLIAYLKQVNNDAACRASQEGYRP